MDSNPFFQLDDQTDEDFFDKLVDDGYEGSKPKPSDISRVFSNLSLGDVGEPEFVENPQESSYKEEVLVGEQNLQSGSSDLVALDSGERSSVAKSDAPKGTSVRVVQWSAFSVGLEQFGQEDGLGSDFLTEKSDVLDAKSDFLDNPVENFSWQEHGSGNGQITDQNDPQYWENLYPGWKYDPVTGQWYQVDGYEFSSETQVDNSNVSSIDAPEKVNTSVSGSTEVSYLQTTSQTMLETIAEDCTVGSVTNWNQGSHGTVEYPPNMVFDPQYPEWYYDTNTQQWHTLESYTQGMNSSSDFAVQEQLSQNVKASAGVSLDQSQSFYGDSSQPEQHIQSQGTQEFGWSWNASQSSYSPQNSVYNNNIQSEQSTSQFQVSQESGGNLDASAANSAQNNSLYTNISQPEHLTNQGRGSQQFGGNLNSSMHSYSQPKIWQPESVGGRENYRGNKQSQSIYNSMSRSLMAGSQIGQQTGFKTFEPVTKHNYGSANGMAGLSSFVTKGSTHQFNQPKVEQTLQTDLSNSYYGDQKNLSNSYYGGQNMSTYPHQSLQGANASYSQFPYAPQEGRSSAGRPPHALVAFGFGGKLIVMKDVNTFGTNLGVGSQGNAGGAVSILSLSEVVAENTDGSSINSGNSCNYFHALCQQPFPGPLVGGNAATKDVNKWIDERIINCESSSMDFRKGEFLKLLLSLLKILCQHYGKLRSPFGADPSQEEIDGPESAVTKLFASARKNGARLTEYGSFTHCMKNLPSEGQIRATAVEVQNLLVSGRRKEALEYAQEGQLWGPALVLAAQLGEKFYVDTVKKMAHRQFVSGSPLRTLCLLIAGQPADVFSADTSINSLSGNALQGSNEILANGMLDDWEENLAMITANRTKDDELVIIHLGDCLLKERGEVTAAHTCYLVSEANFESYSDSARLCLIGADHWKCPRTFASPEAIQRTEVYEYSKVLGNSQFVLLPFQPYKLIYAYMLAEVGKVSESLRYCQAALKLLKNPARTPEVEMWKTSLSSLEERLRTHQQGGYSSNLAPAKLVGKLFTSIDRSIHRMIGAPPAAPLPPMPPSSANGKENFSMASSHSMMTMSSLMPSASVEAISEWAGDDSKKNMHNRSISEPDFGRSPKQNSPKAAAGLADAQNKSSVSGGPSRLGRIGSQLFQKTIGWVSNSRSGRQAKLGETNKFYYDEKLKRWVEEGAEPPAEEAALPPPPTATAFQNGSSDYNINTAIKSQSLNTSREQETRSPPLPSEPSSGIPPIPPSQNQFSARARMGVRSRYVDTFNKGGGGTCGSFTNSFVSPSAPSVKPAVGAKFFVPSTPPPSDALTVGTSGESTEEATYGEPSMSVAEESSAYSSPSAFSSPSASSPPAPPSSMQRYPSMNNITPLANNGSGAAAQTSNGSLSRSRAASWSGTCTGTPNHKMSGLGGSPPPFLPQNPPSTRSNSSSSLQLNGGPLGDELDEVEL
ncbi:protein transport protein SEC16B-like protein [Iris pallida]|uniref:Protein transport protein sec16 n=1 Tax=Iris pallida TaxID=29817 RepID=A0AAX6GFH7_IRIPA|nr:protein transport protein SEC16B-like protein [Iris pallida]